MALMTAREFADKCNWEGGVLPTIFDYGLDHTDLDDETSELYAKVQELAGLRGKVNGLVSEIGALLEAAAVEPVSSAR